VTTRPRDTPRLAIQVFVFLQLLDFLTTLLGLRMGASEASPFIRSLMQWGPVAGLAASKVLALALGGLCIYLGRGHLLRWASYWYGALVVWNVVVLLQIHVVHVG
jgi:hypothetical protein